MIQFLALRVRQWKCRGTCGNAVPNIFDKLQALGKVELIDLIQQRTHTFTSRAR